MLKARGVPEEHILFLNLIASPEGAKKFADQFPKVRVVTAFVDQGLDEKKYVDRPLPNVRIGEIDRPFSYIVPGLGDFGDRFYTM